MSELVYRGIRYNLKSVRKQPAGDPPTLCYRGCEHDPNETRIRQKSEGDPPTLSYRGYECDPGGARPAAHDATAHDAKADDVEDDDRPGVVAYTPI